MMLKMKEELCQAKDGIIQEIVSLVDAPWCSTFTENIPGDFTECTDAREVRGAAFSIVKPTPVKKPHLIAWSKECAELLNLSPITPTLPETSLVLSGSAIPREATPFSLCYGGHQFGSWAGQLGDGRAITLGSLPTRGSNTLLQEVQLKGAGKTPYSRSADGRAVLRSSIREFIAREAMHYLVIPTTRALSLIGTGELVLRDVMYDGNPLYEPGAIVARVAPTFLRFGNFELYASRGEYSILKAITDWTICQWFPELVSSASSTPVIGEESYLRWFSEVCRRTALMIVHWYRVGFTHGVMNTDNMSILGLTIDYGPYGFLDNVDFFWTPNTTDLPGRRYCFGRQAAVAQWNLGCLAEAISPLIDDTEALAQEVYQFKGQFEREYEVMIAEKLGFSLIEPESVSQAVALYKNFISWSSEIETDYTLFFRLITDLSLDELLDKKQVINRINSVVYGSPQLEQVLAWLELYCQTVKSWNIDDQTRRNRMQRVNPCYIPRNYLLQEIIVSAEEGDFEPLRNYADILRNPYTWHTGSDSGSDTASDIGSDRWAAKRPDWARKKVGCSMLSCSS
jgi:uncharacterized protein YdiU (UPF0061 family)